MTSTTQVAHAEPKPAEAQTQSPIDEPAAKPEPMVFEPLPPRFRAWLVGLLVTLLLRARHATWRRDTSALVHFDDILADTQVMAVFWHGKYVPLFTLLQGRRACAFASLSFRGAVIAEVCRRFGHRCVLLPYRGGRRSRAIMRAALRAGGAGALAVDGPLGPNREVKPGAVEMASELGMTVVPVSAASSRKKIDRGRWDLMEVPRLFARVTLLVGEPFRIPPDLSPEEIASWQQRVGSALGKLDQRAEEVEQARLPG